MTAEESQTPRSQEPNSPTPETSKPNELLDLDNYHSLYPRLLIAGTIANAGHLDKAKSVLDPGKKFTQEEIDSIKTNNYELLTLERKYNSVVSGLSMSERRGSWDKIIKDEGFDVAYARWSGSLLSAVHLQETDERKEFLGKLFEKNHAEINDDDILNLYDKYCRGSSDIDGFLQKAMEHSGNIEDVEWLAKRLFGKVSGGVSRRIYELEFAYKSGDFNEINKAIWGS